MEGPDFRRTEADREQLPTEAQLALQGGRRIEAIRIVRERTGMGLAEAKALVDRAERGYEPVPPRRLPGREDGRAMREDGRAMREDAGNLRLFLIIALLAAVVAAVFFL